LVCGAEGLYFYQKLTGVDTAQPALNRGVIMQIGSIVRSVHIAVPQGARGIVMRILGDMAMVAWYAGTPGTSELLNTEPFFLEDLIDTGELVRPANALIH
jgi:hypothetical protein